MSNPEAPREAYDKDRYPRMIVACIVISMLLFTMIVGVLVVDFTTRADTQVLPEPPKGFDSMLEKPRDAVQPKR